MEGLSERVDTITEDLAKVENKVRVRALQEHTLGIDTLAFRLRNSPNNQSIAREVAFEAGARADLFLTDSDLWLWTDVQTMTRFDEQGNVVRIVERVEPDFKTLPALAVYSAAISTWVAAILVASKEDIAVIHSDYRERLRRHIAAVSVRPNWDDLHQPPDSFPEQIRSRITCWPFASTKFAENGVCKYVIKCRNAIERADKSVRSVDILVNDPSPIVLCTADPNLGLLDERDIEEQDHGIVILGVLEQMLRDVERRGTLRQQVIGQFDMTTKLLSMVYGVKQDGIVSWFHQIQPSSDGSWDGPKTAGTGLTDLACARFRRRRRSVRPSA